MLCPGEGRTGNGVVEEQQHGTQKAKGDRLVQGLMHKFRNAAEQALRTATIQHVNAFRSLPLLFLHSCTSCMLHALLRGF